MHVVPQLQSVDQVVMVTSGDLHQTHESKVGTIGVMLYACGLVQMCVYVHVAQVIRSSGQCQARFNFVYYFFHSGS